LEAGVVKIDDWIAGPHLGAVVDDPFDGGRSGAALGACLDANDDVAVLGRFERAALDDGDAEGFLLDGPGRAVKGSADETRDDRQGAKDDRTNQEGAGHPDVDGVLAEEARLLLSMRVWPAWRRRAAVGL